MREDVPLRFKKGDRVEANTSYSGTDWVVGKVVSTWEDGHAYRIELENAEKTQVWGPVDSDQYVRALGA